MLVQLLPIQYTRRWRYSPGTGFKNMLKRLSIVGLCNKNNRRYIIYIILPLTSKPAMMRKTIVWIAIAAILLISIHYLFLSRKAPKETYRNDSFLDSVQQKRAVIIVAHDDDG